MGRKKALIALGHLLLRIVYQILLTKTPYEEIGPDSRFHSLMTDFVIYGFNRTKADVTVQLIDRYPLQQGVNQA